MDVESDPLSLAFVPSQQVLSHRQVCPLHLDNQGHLALLTLTLLPKVHHEQMDPQPLLEQARPPLPQDDRAQHRSSLLPLAACYLTY